MTKRRHVTDHARHDPAHVLAPGLFRSLKPGERKRAQLDITYEFGEGESLQFSGRDPLGAFDLRTLQGLVALAGPNGILLDDTPDTAVGQQLRLALDARIQAAGQDGLVVKDSMTKLLQEVGLAHSGRNITLVKDSIRRMSGVIITIRQGGREAGGHCLLSYVFEDSSGVRAKVWTAVNPRIAAAVLGRRPYARIEMAEVRALSSDPARLVHQRLCGWLVPGKSRHVTLDTIISYVWPDATNNDNTLKTRRRVARKALNELAELPGWTVSEYVRGKWKITRPAAQADGEAI